MNKEFLIGTAGAVGASALWEHIPGHEQFKTSLMKATSLTGEPEKSPLAFLEHYHYGMASLIAGKKLPKYSSYLYGFGAGMIASELFQEKPFGIGKTEWETRGNFTMLVILSIMGALI